MPEEQDQLVAKFVIKSGWATEQQVKESLKAQKKIESEGETPPPLVDILVEREFISPSQKEAILKEYGKKGLRLFGEIAVSLNSISPEQLNECLEIQKRMRSSGQEDTLTGFATQIGQILLSKNYLQEEKISEILKVQQTEAEERQISICKYCGTQFNLKLITPGKKVKCGKCGQILEPSSSEVPSSKKKPRDSEAFTDATITRPKKKKSGLTLSLPQFTRSRKKKIPGYDILDVLGEDGISMTYKGCYNIDKSKLVVIKLFDEENCADEQFISNLEKAVKQSASLNVPNLRKNYGIGNFKDKNGQTLYYVVSEFIEGDSLYQLVKQNVEITVEKAVKIASRIAKILQYACEQEIYHGDVCLDNILISKDGKVFLLNLGIPTKVAKNILKLVEQEGSAPLYISPEVASNQTVDFRSDIYSLGALLYHLLAGRSPFEGASPFEIINRVTEQIPLPPIHVYNPQVPLALFKIIEKMMAPEPDQRYQSYAELINHFKEPERINAPEKLEEAKETTSEGNKEAPGEDSKEEQDDTLRLVRNTQNTPPIPWVKVAVILLVIAGIGYLVYNKMEADKRLENAKQRYFSLQDNYAKGKNDPKMWNDLEKQINDYIGDCQDIEFPEGKDTVKSAREHLEELNKTRTKFSDTQVSSRLNKSNSLMQQQLFFSSLDELEQIPRDLITPDINSKIMAMRRDILKRASSWFCSTIKEATDVCNSVQEDKEFTKFAVNMPKFKTACENLENSSAKIVEEKWKKELVKILEQQNLAKFQHESLVKLLQQEGMEKFSKELEKKEAFIVDDNQCKVLMGIMLKQLEQQVEILKKKFQDYQRDNEQKIVQQSTVALDEILREIEYLREQYDYKKACDKITLKISRLTSERAVNQLKEIQETLQSLEDAKQIIIKNINKNINANKSEMIPIHYQDIDYLVDKLTTEKLFLKPKSKKKNPISQPWREFKDQLHVLAKAASKNATEDECLAISFFCIEECRDYDLAHEILNKIASRHEKSKAYMEKIKVDFANKSQELLKIIQNAELKDGADWKTNVEHALNFKNQYLIKASAESDNVVNRFFEKAWSVIFPSPHMAYFEFSNPEQYSEQNMKKQGFELQPPELTIKDNYLHCRTSLTISGNNIRGVCGLCLFTKANQKLTVDLGDYYVQIPCNSKDLMCKTPKRETKKIEIIGIQKWTMFALFIKDNYVYWYIDAQNIHKSECGSKEITKISFSPSGGEVFLDNLYIGRE